MKDYKKIFNEDLKYEEYIQRCYSISRIDFLIKFGRNLKKQGICLETAKGFSKEEWNRVIFEDDTQSIAAFFFENDDKDCYINALMFAAEGEMY